MPPQGVWISDPVVMFSAIATITLTIKENRFMKRFELSDGRDGFEQTGSINVVGPVVTGSGLAGRKIDVVYEDSLGNIGVRNIGDIGVEPLGRISAT